MKKAAIITLALFLGSPAAFASFDRYAPKYHEHETDISHEHGNDRDNHNFYLPLEVETNITPQQFRSRYFQGIYSTNGVELVSGEPVWFAGAIAKFDVFPERVEA